MPKTTRLICYNSCIMNPNDPQSQNPGQPYQPTPDPHTPAQQHNQYPQPYPDYQSPAPNQNQQAPNPQHQGQPPAVPYDQPVAYDQYGRPLYAHPPQPSSAPQPQQHIVHVARPINPEEVHIPEDIQRRHDEARQKYPNLNLSRGEFIISAVKRHPIGIVKIWALAIALIFAFGGVSFYLFLGENPAIAANPQQTQQYATLGMALVLIPAILVSLGAMVATYVYRSNRFYLTNESVIQEIMTSLFSTHEQTVSLANIEDASFKQTGILPMLLNYGTIRLSTEGDETTYMFTYVSKPKRHIAVLNNAVEAFKNGRPVQFDDEEKN